MALWNDPGHQCAGCIYNKIVYGVECEGCRRKSNTEYGTPEEELRFIVLPDKYTAVEVVSYGTHKVLVKK